jgi:hypothetical protein
MARAAVREEGGGVMATKQGGFDMSVTCVICQRDFKNLHALSTHLPQAHSISMPEYKVQYLNEEWPLCACGCGEPVPWDKHYGCWRKYKSPAHVIKHNGSRRYGPEHHNWKGGRVKMGDRYFIKMPGHPRAINGYVREHVLVMEKILGRFLAPDEHVHHINGDKGDNRPENLMVLSNAEHTKLHMTLNHPFRYSEEELRIILKTISQNIGRIPTLRDLHKYGYAPSPFYRVFGSYCNALKEVFGSVPRGREKKLLR